jgi:methionine sulfoxide reductase heme-binding subunit
MQPRFLPWLERNGKLSPLKLAVFVALFLPAAWTAGAFLLDALGPRPLNEAIHQMGLWMIRLLLISLAMTPARQALHWPRLVLVRRMVGVAAFTYGLIHLTLYVADQSFDLRTVASEIVLRFYLTIGFIALLGLAVLAVTSTDAMIRRLGGRRWRRIHQLIYGIALLGTVHYFIQSKLEVWEPTIVAGIYGWLMAYRLIAWRAASGRVPLWGLASLSIAAGVATALAETLYFWLWMGAPPALVLAANLSLSTGVRPGWVVLAVGLAFTAAAVARAPARRTRLHPA